MSQKQDNSASQPTPKKRRKRGEKEIFHLEPWQEKLVNENLELVDKLVRGMLRRLPSHIDKADLIQQGRIGLMEAARRYDPTSAASFRTFASYRIRGEIIDGLRAHSNGKKDNGWNESIDSISGGARGSSNTIGGFISSVKSLSMAYELATSSDENVLEESMEKSLLWEAVKRLPERERRVCELLYQVDMTMQDIAEVIGTSKASVSRLHKRALQRLREDKHLNNGEGFLSA